MTLFIPAYFTEALSVVECAIQKYDIDPKELCRELERMLNPPGYHFVANYLCEESYKELIREKGLVGLAEEN